MSEPIYEFPQLAAEDVDVLGRIDDLQEQIRLYLKTPRRWSATLNRAQRARLVQGSNSIEGYDASEDDVAALLDGDSSAREVAEETRLAILGYRVAMDFVLQQCVQALPGQKTVPTTVPLLDLGRLQALHFMLLGHDRDRNPGRWRPGYVAVVRSDDGTVAYTAPDRELVEPLLTTLCEVTNASESPRLVTAAMAHLNLVMIHPFSDGNGRMARIVQSLVLGAAVGAAAPVPLTPDFGSIEEYLGEHTPDYYAALTALDDGTWSPDRSARSWLRFCLTAHYRQARRIIRRIADTGALEGACQHLAEKHGLANRVVGTLCESARGWMLTRRLYVARTRRYDDEKLSDGQASRDLAALVGAGLLEAVGEKRGRSYRPTPTLADVWERVRQDPSERETEDPYQLQRPIPF